MRAPSALAGSLLLFASAGACAGDPEPQRVRAVAPTSTTTTTTVAPTTTTLPPAPPPRPARASRRASSPRVRYTVDEATKARVIAAIYAYSDWDAARMVRVASCESGLNPYAVNQRSGATGIFQIIGATPGLIEEHVALAHRIWLKRGMAPWVCKG